MKCPNSMWQRLPIFLVSLHFVQEPVFALGPWIAWYQVSKIIFWQNIFMNSFRQSLWCHRISRFYKLQFKVLRINIFLKIHKDTLIKSLGHCFLLTPFWFILVFRLFEGTKLRVKAKSIYRVSWRTLFNFLNLRWLRPVWKSLVSGCLLATLS